jgi:hypothetical protein
LVVFLSVALSVLFSQPFPLGSTVLFTAQTFLLNIQATD